MLIINEVDFMRKKILVGLRGWRGSVFWEGFVLRFNLLFLCLLFWYKRNIFSVFDYKVCGNLKLLN